ncbi:hexokinase [Enteropsectra breve]|nr:hexokinase [Enteropsectra breve]
MAGFIALTGLFALHGFCSCASEFGATDSYSKYCKITRHSKNSHAHHKRTNPDYNELDTQLFDTYTRNLTDYSMGKENIFYDTHIDFKKLKNLEAKGQQKILVIDVGGTSFKYSFVALDRSRVTHVSDDHLMAYKPFSLDRPLSSYTWHEWVAEAIKRSLLVNENENVVAALTFSYCMNQSAINRATINTISKNWPFMITDSLFSEDIISVLEESFKAKGLNIEVKCIINDSVATYAASCIKDKSGRGMGIILGTGTNACFVTKGKSGTDVLVNSEWAKTEVPEGYFTKADNDIIENLKKANKTYQPLEVLTAGYRYVEIINRQIHRRNIERKPCYTLQELKAIYETPKNECLSPKDKEVLGLILEYKTRASRILAAMVVAFAKYNGIKKLHLTLNGSIYENPNDIKLLQEEIRGMALRQKHKLESHCDYEKNASLYGAAYIAACY